MLSKQILEDLFQSLLAIFGIKFAVLRYELLRNVSRPVMYEVLIISS